MAFAGHMMIELIQPKDDKPSVYQEIIQRRGYGFHTSASPWKTPRQNALPTSSAAITWRSQLPCPAVAPSTTWAMGLNAPGFVELIPATPGMDERFTRYWRASVDWNGRDPIGPFG